MNRNDLFNLEMMRWKRLRTNTVKEGISWDILTTADSTVYTLKYQGTAGVVDWGDGTTENLASASTPTNKAHTYANAGTHTVKITGYVVYIQAGADTDSQSMIRTIHTMNLSGYTSITKSAANTGEFYNCTNADIDTDFSFSTSITSLAYTFYGCSSLSKAPIIPESVTNLTQAFRGCSSLAETPVIPKNVTTLFYAFYGCTLLPEAPVIPSGVNNVQSAFYGCSNITLPPVLPSGITTLDGTFRLCTKLTEAPVIPQGVVTLSFTFWGCSSLEHAPVIPSSVTNMYSTFNNCLSLTVPPILPSGVSNISYTFANCTGLENIDGIWPESFTATSIDISYMFFRTRSLGKPTGTAPAALLWEDTSKTWTSTEAFANCTSLTNYADIPAGWK